ncbi:TetR/AcrR family transcriptional regulator [Ectobacillus ponti]|uniref:TetR/AcrR family transcriptional regulator n=1 Tax=Ectobacillus ponti TaxID=2961894 RepID=A0AA41XBK8_9BACI|nr:TetR/AcrR family transcriptional regulator [Ectobacillus ponti]MCP8969960.1 TetR/AcrR family transcriptional regulator [Ectobacillus ponti]
MHDRKQHVMKMAHQLFIDKGFQATSIQDILEYSGISKGTFYNYFSSKNELLISLFKTLHQQMEQERNELLIGQDPADLAVFARQIELHLQRNRENKLITLFEEVMFSNDEELKEFLKKGQLQTVNWVYRRFLDLFGEAKQPFLLDCAIMFLGILHHNLKYYGMVHQSNANLDKVVHYSVARLVSMVEETAASDDQLFPPKLLESWLPEYQDKGRALQGEIRECLTSLKQQLSPADTRYIQLLDFLQEESHIREPRRFLMESAWLSLQAGPFPQDDLRTLQTLLAGI